MGSSTTWTLNTPLSTQHHTEWRACDNHTCNSVPYLCCCSYLVQLFAAFNKSTWFDCAAKLAVLDASIGQAGFCKYSNFVCVLLISAVKTNNLIWRCGLGEGGQNGHDETWSEQAHRQKWRGQAQCYHTNLRSYRYRPHTFCCKHPQNSTLLEWLKLISQISVFWYAWLRCCWGTLRWSGAMFSAEQEHCINFTLHRERCSSVLPDPCIVWHLHYKHVSLWAHPARMRSL